MNVIKDPAKTPMSLKDYNLMEMQERVGVAPEHVLGKDQEPKCPLNWTKESLDVSDSHPILSSARLSRDLGGQIPLDQKPSRRLEGEQQPTLFIG